MRTFTALVFGCCFLLGIYSPVPVQAQDELSKYQEPQKTDDGAEDYSSKPRIWTAASDSTKTISASIVKVNPTTVVLKMEDSGQEKVVRKSTLSKKDQIYLDLVNLIADDNTQYGELQSILDGFQAGKYPKVEDIQPIHIKYPKSPYATMLMGIAAVNSHPDYDKAVPYFEKAVKNVAERHALVNNIMPTTYISCCVNCAVAQWRAGGGSVSVKLLDDASKFSQTPELIFHNGGLMAKEDGFRMEKLRLSGKPKATLRTILAKQTNTNPKTFKEQKFYFSLNLDPPPSLHTLDEVIQDFLDNGKDANAYYSKEKPFQDLLAGKNLPYEPWCRNCAGRGLIRCPAKCNRGVISVPKTVLEGVNTLNGKPIYNERYVDAPCPTCSGKGVAGTCEVCRGTGRQ
jgi:hypothetical protein